MEAPFSHPQFQNNQKLTMLQQYQQQQQEQQQLQLQQVQQFQQQQNQTQSPLPQFSQLQLQQPQLGTTPSQPGQPSPLLLQYQQQQLLRQQQQGAQPPVGSVGLGATTAPKPPLAANPPQFAMIKIQENMDNILKYMKDLDGRLTRLESSVGDLLRVYKAQEMKLEEIRSLSKKAVETPVVQPAPSSYYTKPAANNVTQSNYGSPGFVPQPVFNPNHKASAPSQEQSDLALARELQAKFDQEATKEPTKEAIKKPASNSVPATTGATSECPVCSKAIPVAQIESHVAEHFDDDAPETDSKSTDSENPGFWGKLFGGKKPAKDAPKETKPSTTPSSSASTNNTAPRSSQASPVVMPPPGQPTTMLAYPNAYYPGVAPAPGFYPSNTALPALYPMQFTTAPMVLPPSNNAPKN